MIREGEAVGCLVLRKPKPGALSPRQVELLETFAAQAVIAIENVRLFSELSQRTDDLTESLEYQMAISDVLKVISRSAFDLQPVLETLAESSARLCAGQMAFIYRRQGDDYHLAATHGFSPEYHAYMSARPITPGRETMIGRVALTGNVVHIFDAARDPEYTWVEARELGGYRTMLGVPLAREGVPVGAICVVRREAKPFSERQIELMKTFADQALIAMENARLFAETKEALERQTATADILKVIAGSPNNVQPVLEAVAAAARRFCGADDALIILREGTEMVTSAHDGPLTASLGYRRSINRNSTGALAIADGVVVHHADVIALDPAEHSETLSLAREHGYRAALAAPMLRECTAIGSIVLRKSEPGAFTPRQIELLETFAAQAVIAIENVRLFNETKEALDQQTATAEVLQVINSSPGDLTPVFDAMLDKATRLSEAAFGILWTYDGERFQAVAFHNVPPAYVEFLQEPQLAGPMAPLGRVARGEAFAHVPDLAADEYRERAGFLVRQGLSLGGFRTVLAVPMRKDASLLGAITIYRREVQPFSEKQIALLQSFAAQAVIAMENARLITEQREALEQQTATAEVLQVINSSPGDLTPVFDTMLEKAMTLCCAAFGFLTSYDGRRFTPVAMRGVPPLLADYFSRGMDQPSPGEAHFRILEGEDVIHNLDQKDEEAYRSGLLLRRAVVDLGGARTAIVVALRKDDVVLGALTLYRKEVRPFSDKQIALMRSFAAQAVIAIENARLLSELHTRTGDLEESLEYQTATSDLLTVISRSTSDIQPVLDTMLASAAQLCGSQSGGVAVRQGEDFQFVVSFGWPPEYDQMVRARKMIPGRGTVTERVLLEKKVVHVRDTAADPEYTMSETIILGHVGTGLGVPLLREGDPIGVILLTRDRVEPFTDRQIALVRTFADQAVIAMENARLLGQLRERTEDLQESLEYQTATSDVLKVISRSTFDLQGVLDTLSATAARLCAAELSFMTRREGDAYCCVTAIGSTPETTKDAVYLKESVLDRHTFAAGRGSITGRVVAEARPVQIVDLPADPEYLLSELTTIGKIRTLLGVPMMREGAVIGTMNLARQRVEPFTEKQIELVRTFADQAVIAIENARLLGELTRREEELRVTFDHMGDGVAMFDADLRLASWNRNFQQIMGLAEPQLAARPSYADYLRMLAERGEFGSENVEAVLANRLEGTDRELRLERTRPDGSVIEARRNAVPGGGFVLIYSDVTERRRSEQAIRAARDAAEQALDKLKAAQANLVQSEKMASLGQLTAGIAHEIKNPLNFVNNFAGLSVELLNELKEVAGPALDSLDEERRAEIAETMDMITGNLDKIAEHGKRADGIVKSMLSHSRGGTGDWQQADINALVEEALNLAYHGARAQDKDFNITLERDFEKTSKSVDVVPQDVTRVFLNLFGNGFYAANKRRLGAGEPGFRPTIRVSTRDLGDRVEIRVRDNGIGIPPELRDKLFQPFFTTKPTGEGTGLGLSISYDIVTQQHGGSIEVESEAGSFTEFTVCLPRGRRAASSGRA
jgi:PAS domain S-box-containing protein